MSAYLHGPAYVLGENEADHTTIPGLADRAAALKLAPDPSLWGWGSIHRTERSLAELAVDTGRASLAVAGVAASSVDALMLCSTRIPGSSEGHGEFAETILTGIGLGDIPYYGQTLNRCVNLLAALDIADAFVTVGRYRRILVVTTDRVADEADRMTGYALFSDGAAGCLVSAEPDAADGYQIVACATAQHTASLEWSKEISADLSRQVNDALLTPRGMKPGDVCGLLHGNQFTPLVVMKELQAGFSAGQLYTDNISRVGHCFAADPLINLVDRAAHGQVHGDHHYLLATSVPGSRIGVLLRRLT